MLSATDLACSRGERPLFSGLSFDLQAGDWLHVKGENGAGKTTLLRTLVGLSPADHGDVRWDGTHTRAMADDYRRHFVYLGHPPALKDELSPLENLRLALAVDGIDIDIDAPRLAGALHRLGLQGCESLPAHHLSAGQKRRVLLARLLLRPASLWVLDEPFNALDGPAVELLCTLIADHLRDGGIAVLTSHQPVPLPGGQELLL
jgi:heme exporter protein A